MGARSGRRSAAAGQGQPGPAGAVVEREPVSRRGRAGPSAPGRGRVRAAGGPRRRRPRRPPRLVRGPVPPRHRPDPPPRRRTPRAGPLVEAAATAARQQRPRRRWAGSRRAGERGAGPARLAGPGGRCRAECVACRDRPVAGLVPAEVSPLPGGTDAWLGSRFEHRFRIGTEGRRSSPPRTEAATSTGTASTRPQSSSTSRLTGAAWAGTPEVHALLASPLRYPGMPADRLWEMEDAQVNLGLVESEPWDLARLLVGVRADLRQRLAGGADRRPVRVAGRGRVPDLHHHLR